jgi:para-nitrobenzyl esterase
MAFALRIMLKKRHWVRGRRDLLRYSLVAAALLPIGEIFGRKSSRPLVGKSYRSCTVETESGKVLGRYIDGVVSFKGIPYGASPGGANRFMPPNKAKSWVGTFEALEYGPMASQSVLFAEDPANAVAKTSVTREIEKFYAGLERSGPNTESEDCLVLNVWTPEVGGHSKRAVMVWLHGGGFSAGSGDWRWTDGANLSRENDVVVVSLNHRLNVFGHLYLGDIGGDRYAASGNAGMLDIVRALEWVRDNIAEFGGDPDNVTIFGQSGGGCKVNVLMAMPAAKGLFHKAIQMSGPGPRMLTREQATLTASKMLNCLAIKPTRLDRLQEVPAESLLMAAKRVLSESNLSPDSNWRSGTWFHMFDPVVDEVVLPHHPFDPQAPLVSAHVPMLIGNCNDESRIDAVLGAPTGSHTDELSAERLRANLGEMGIDDERARYLIQSYQSSHPEFSMMDLFSAIATDLEYRMDAIVIAERKAALAKAPAFMYLFTWSSPAFGGQFKSAHGVEQPFVFDNLDSARGLWGPQPDPRRYELAQKMSQTWVNFARTGTPTHRALPDWTAYSGKDRGTMLLNYACEWVYDPRREDRLAAEKSMSSLRIHDGRV